jgi:hypothetical protein
MARRNKPAPKKPTIIIPPRQQNTTVAAIHESDEPLEFPESPPSTDNGKRVDDQPYLKLEEVQESLAHQMTLRPRDK